MDALALQEKIIQNPDLIIELLDAMGFEYIKDCGRYIQFPNLDGDNRTACSILKDNLHYENFTRGISGNLFTLVMQVKGLRFPEALEYVAKELKLTDIKDKKKNYPFNSFFLKLEKNNSYNTPNIPTYDNIILKDYECAFSQLFFKDGISYQTQEYFNVGYDIESNRITIPEYTIDGKLCGIMGRLNSSKCDNAERWLPIIKCSRSLTLYGYHRNYETIQSKGLAIITESEKGVMQLHSYGCNIGLATCGCNVSDTQARYLQGLMVPKLVLAYDEGLGEEHLRKQAKKLKSENCFLRNQVGYIYDRNGEILKQGTKASPTDLGKESFKALLKNKVIWV